MHKLLQLFGFLLLCYDTAFTQTLPRKAFVGLQLSDKNKEIVVDSVMPLSTAAQMGLKKSDIIITINNIACSQADEFQTTANVLRTGDPVNIQFVRDKNNLSASGIAIAKPYFKASWCDVIYQSLPAIGCTVRTIIYKPKSKISTPAVFFIPGYNCGSIEGFANNFNGKMIEGWVKKGYTVYTVEKSGLGDSKDCRPCMEADLQTDIELFETAYRDFAALPYVDRNNLFIWGHSMGGIIAPMIVSKQPVKGIIVFGTVFRPWSEFLLEMHRVQKPLLDSLDYEQTETFVRLIQKVYYEFFVLKKSPAELFQNPAYKNIVETELEYKPGKEDMWGRHWRFWQQLDSINLAVAWQRVNCKVLAFQGGADFIQCAAVEPYLIAATVNKSHPGNATMVTIPQLDHLLMHSRTFEEAVKNMNQKEYLKGNFDNRLLNESIRWMDKLQGK
ncbi:MAG: alpha/beta fold hydrolase [Chitinophagaceae bacterium]|nr:alpha/beta fold hydrolase [Chitinophagaceae bacterium]